MMRTLLLLLSALLSLAAAAFGYLAYTGKLSLPVYIVLMTAAVIVLIFLCGHLLYNHFARSKNKK